MKVVNASSCGVSVALQVPTDDAWGVAHDGLIWHRDGATVLSAEYDGTPALDPTGGPLTPNGPNVQGFDTTNPSYNPALSTRLPIRLRPGQRLLLAKFGTLQQQGGVLAQSRDYWPAFPVQSGVKRLGGVICVDRPPGDPLDLRPTVFGGPGQAALRQWIPVDQLRAGVAKLPRLTDLVMPDPIWRNWFELFTGDAMGGWNAHTVAPAEQHPGYGREVAAAVSMQALRLVGPESDDIKLRLALGLIQFGLDTQAAILAGRPLYAKGGHCAGRKFPMVLGGYLLGISQMRDPTTTARAEGIAVPTQEDDAYQLGEMWWTDQARPCWRMASDGGPLQDGSEWRRVPSSWVRGTDHTDFPFAVHGYFSHSHAAQVGSVAVARLLGLEREFGTVVSAVEQYMRPPAVMRSGLETIGVDWSGSWGDADVCAQNYLRLFPD